MLSKYSESGKKKWKAFGIIRGEGRKYIYMGANVRNTHGSPPPVRVVVVIQQKRKTVKKKVTPITGHYRHRSVHLQFISITDHYGYKKHVITVCQPG